MSTLKTRIEDYVGSVGDDTFLGDALTDTASEVLRALPVSKLGYFSEETADQTSNGVNINNHKVLSVVRENGTDGEYVECKEVSPSYFRKAQDSNSMFAGTIETPVYTIKNSKVHVFPAPAVSPNAIKLETVKFPTITAGQTFIDESGTTEFTQTLTDVIVLGASTKAVQYLMARVKDSLPSTPTLDLSGISAPSTPSAPSISYSNASLGNATSAASDAIASAQDAINTAQSPYTGETITQATTSNASATTSSESTAVSGTAATASDVSAYTSPSLEGSDVSKGLLSMSDGTVNLDADQIDYDKWWDITAEFIEEEEDAELANLQMEKIRTYIAAFNSEVADAQNAMQATISDARLATDAAISTARDATQASIQNARNAHEEAFLNARLQSDASTTNARIDASIEEASISSKTAASTAKMRESTGAAISKMNNSTSAAIAKMRESTGAAVAQMQASTNVNVQNAARTLEASIQDYAQEVDNFRVGIQKFSAQISSKVNEYTSRIQQYSSQVDRYVREYSWYQDQYARFDAKFKEALQVVIEN